MSSLFSMRDSHEVVDIGNVVFQFPNELAAAVGAFDLAVAEEVDFRQQVALQQVDAAIGVAARPVVAVGEVEDVDVPQFLRILLFDDLVAEFVRRRDHRAAALARVEERFASRLPARPRRE